MRLANKVALITGSSRGLGFALTKAFAAEGAAVVMNARHGDTLEQAAAEVLAAIPRAEVLAVAADAANPAGVERLVGAALERFGRIDVLINNASILGPSPRPPLIEYSYEAFLEVLRVNTLGPFLLTKAVLPGMLARGSGSIINVISEAGLVGYPQWGAYGVSKAGLELMTQIWAAELEGSGVRINSINPGEMDTEMHFLAYPEEDRAQFTPPEEVVEPFIYLASDETLNISGVCLNAQPEEEEGVEV